ncbi:MAG TPA: aldolase/citrate lyase family protein [Dehalococcoidia bacterium]|nr:aldolase/citrate lyase family protein [Dehalococcoidia bacterium]
MAETRSFFLVPAGDNALIDQARASSADAVVLDLASANDEARGRVGLALAALKGAGKAVYVRLSPMSTDRTRDDLAAALGGGLDGIVYPNAQSARDIRQLDVLTRQQEMTKKVKPGLAVLIPEISSARGLLRAEEIVQASTRIRGLAIDGDGLDADLGVERTLDRRELEHARRVIVVVCAAYGLISVDAAGADAAYARSIGFKAKYALTPGQVDAIAQAYK